MHRKRLIATKEKYKGKNKPTKERTSINLKSTKLTPRKVNARKSTKLMPKDRAINEK
jgi:hypothetical protein